ncbi:HEAT repeat domain-containing protein [Isosphaeraceae bacterium EP7]
MPRTKKLASRVLILALLATSESLQPARAGEAQVNGRSFALKDGFEVQLIAGPPLVDRPVTADFDEQGALYVCDSSGSNDPPAKQLIDLPHRVVKLVDTDGDGTFDTRTIFADKMMFPSGTLWHDGSLYVAAPPSIWKLTDTDNDGVADRRDEWYKGNTLTGCANDLHGPYLGPDGRIYWAKGAFAEQAHDLPGRAPSGSKAAHIFRAKSDGTAKEAVMTGGMDNPVDVAFSGGGERFFTTTFLQNPAGGKRDGILHAIYGGIYGKPNAVTDDHPHTSPGILPVVMTHLGPAAPSGLAMSESRVNGDDHFGNLYAAQFSMQKISRHVLVPDGATFTTRDENLISCADRDFHPTDVLEDADGSIVVFDTGGWYKLCCPTSQLEKPDVLGAIYRVKKSGLPKLDDPRGLKLAWANVPATDLAARLADSRPAVIRRALKLLGEAGAGAVPALATLIKAGTTADTRRNAVWAATRIDAPSARDAVRPALADADESVRQAAIHSASVTLDRPAAPLLITLLASPSRQNARAAAEALGRLGDASAIPALLDAIDRSPDVVLEHSLIFALIELNLPDATAPALAGPSDARRRAALIALDQMPAGRLTSASVASALTSTDPGLRESGAWIMVRHPEWADDLGGTLRDRLSSADLAPTDRAALESQLARFAKSPTIQALISGSLADAQSTVEVKLSLLRTMAQARPGDVPDSWLAALSQAIKSEDRAVADAAIAAARSLPLDPKKSAAITRTLLEVARTKSEPTKARLAALAAIPGGLQEVDGPTFVFLADRSSLDLTPADLGASVEVLSRAKLTPEQLEATLPLLRDATPFDLDRLVTAYLKSDDAVLGRKLLDALEVASSRSSLRIGTLKPVLDHFGESLRPAAEAFLATLDVDQPKQRARLEQLLGQVKGGDIRRGQALFNGTKAACATCHAIGYQGGKLGPDLSAIGKIREERDLLEAIAFPSASFVRSYEPVAIATRSGNIHSGILTAETSDELVLTVAADRELRIPRADIEELRPSTVSVMPAGFDQQLTTQEFADILAFLKSRR